jgi:type I restriction enzyme, S subunit
VGCGGWGMRGQKVPKGYKQTEVGVIPEDWDVSTVGTEFSIQLGKMIDAEKNLGVLKPYLGNRAIQWGRIELNDIGLVALTPSDIQNFRLKAGDLLVCEGGEIGRAAIWNNQLPECYYQKALHRLRPIQGYDIHLMLYVLQYFADTNFLNNFVTQTSIAHLPKEKFVQVPLAVPPIEEQKLIARALSDIDALIEALEGAIGKKRHIKQGAMQELLTGKSRLPGFDNPERKKTEIGEVPSDWDVVQIGNIANVKTGPFGSSLHESDYVNDGTPIITVEHLGERGVLYSNLPLVSDSDKKRLGSYLLDEGDIVFSRVGSVDRNARISSAESGWLFSGRLLRLRSLDSKRIDTNYLSYYFHSEPFKQRVYKVAVGQTMASLNTQILKSIFVALPLLPEQQAIATILSDMDTEIATLEAKLTKTRQLKQGMMHELLTGRIRLV